MSTAFERMNKRIFLWERRRQNKKKRNSGNTQQLFSYFHVTLSPFRLAASLIRAGRRCPSSKNEKPQRDRPGNSLSRLMSVLSSFDFFTLWSIPPNLIHLNWWQLFP